MSPFPPTPDRLNRTELAERQQQRLCALLGEIIPANPFWTQKLREAGIDPAAIRTVADLDKLPFATKEEIADDQADHPPYGTNLTYEPVEYSRLHQTSGTTTGQPLRWLDTPASWQWFLDCWQQIFRLVGLTREDRLAFPFSFGPFVGFWAAFEGANRLGNLCLAGGGMTSQGRLQLIADNRASIVCCTPTYAMRLAEVAAAEGIDLSRGPVRGLIVAGEPGGSIPAIRQRIETAWGARVFDHWGMTELGALAVECVESPGSLHLLEGECIAEIIDPASTRAVAAGEQGELVITNLGRLGSPLLRYRTGDLVQVEPAPCGCGRSLLRLAGGILGRVDDMLTIRGNNVFPSSIEAILREFDAVAEYRIEVRTVRAMQHVRIEVEPAAGCTAEQTQQLLGAVAGRIKDRLNFQAEVVAVPANSLPRFEFKARRFFRIDEE